jgi:hypothetical protein
MYQYTLWLTITLDCPGVAIKNVHLHESRVHHAFADSTACSIALAVLLKVELHRKVPRHTPYIRSILHATVLISVDLYCTVSKHERRVLVI